MDFSGFLLNADVARGVGQGGVAHPGWGGSQGAIGALKRLAPSTFCHDFKYHVEFVTDCNKFNTMWGEFRSIGRSIGVMRMWSLSQIVTNSKPCGVNSEALEEYRSNADFVARSSSARGCSS